MTNPSHPSGLIDPADAETLRLFAADAELLGHLHDQQTDLIYKHKWFQLFVPAIYGGLELSVPEGVRIQEGLAWADGSTAWVVTLCSGANWFSGFLDPSIAGEVFRDARACIAGSGQSTGVAALRGTQYEVSGRWNYTSGAVHATAFTANCKLPEEKDAIGTFLFLKEEVEILRTWKTVGMRATGSEAFSVQGRTIHANRRFYIEPSRASLDLPLFRFPFMQLAAVTLAANSSGMALRFLDLYEAHLSGASIKAYERQMSISIFERHSAELLLLRRDFYKMLDRAWQELQEQGAITPLLLNSLSTISFRLATGSRCAVDEIYPLCGLRAANPDTEINRVWRNLHTASQHALLRFPPLP